jgi:hypothetical protein
MKLRAIVLALAALFATSSLASAQQQTGEIFGKVTDGFLDRQVLERVPREEPVLLRPLTAVTSERGLVGLGFLSALIPSGSSSLASRPWSTKKSSSPSVSARP